MRSSMMKPAFFRMSWMRRTTSRARPSKRSSGVMVESMPTSGVFIGGDGQTADWLGADQHLGGGHLDRLTAHFQSHPGA